MNQASICTIWNLNIKAMYVIRAHDFQYIVFLLSYFKQTFLQKLCVEAIQLSATGERLLKWFVIRIMVDLQNCHRVLLFEIQGSRIDRWWWDCSHLSAVCSHKQNSGQFLILPTACQHIQRPLIANNHNCLKQLGSGSETSKVCGCY